MTHYVQLVQHQLSMTLAQIESALFDAVFLSVAVSPAGDRRVEFDFHPNLAPNNEFEQLRQKITDIETPLILKGPIAFAFHVQMRSAQHPVRPLSIFPSLRESIEAVGVEPAIRSAFGMQPDTASATTEPVEIAGKWWQRLMFWRRSTVASAGPTPEDRFALHEQWLQRCESFASECSWIDLKRTMIKQPDDLRFRAAFAAKHSQEETWTSAIEWYDDLIGRAEDCVPLLGRRARLHLHVGNSEAALRDYSRAIEQAPHHASFRIERSAIYWNLQAWEKVRQDLDAAIRLAPIDPEPLFHRARTHLEQNNPAAAINDFREAIRLDPNFGQALFQLGWLLSCFDAEMGSEAIEHLSRAIALTDDDNIRLHRGLAYLRQNKLASALDDCDQVLAVDPDNAIAHGTRGRVLQCEEQFEDAIIACSRAIELGYEDVTVYLSRAISYASTDQPTLAASDCEMALSLEPNNAWAVQLQGRLKLHTGDLDAAMEAFHRACELAPDWAEPREHVSLVHRIKENPQASVDEQTLLIVQHPNQASHYVNRAFAYTELNDYSEAANDYDRAIELEPENEQIYFLRGVFRMRRQEPDLALADFDRVLAIAGDDDNARANRVHLLLQLNRYQDAIDECARLIEKYPEHPHAYSARAFALAAIGDAERAEEHASRAMEISPESADEIQRSTETANFYRLLRAEAYDTALDAANQIIADYPDESLGYRLRGHARWVREDYVEACDDYNRVIEMNGPSSDCLSARGQIQAELGELDLALADLNQAVELARQAGQIKVLAHALNGRSLTLAGLERYEESAQDFEESVILCPTNPGVYYHRGIQKFHRDEPVEAKVLLELALEFNDPPLSKRKKQRANTLLNQLKTSDSTTPLNPP